ncbi:MULTISPECIES: CinA family protein [Helicobacter]|uniref:Competence/damage-inducible protein CinA domain n=1 Tax=Helicobacter bilis ATCC 43879 TaxID=613026 RepID=C3XEX9_9HELI|nr:MULTISPECIES: CinA family protein [Helicobacter]EEO23568.1 competence/damage-inducible protein CinA domain [Helicobacter bilis ATCC 43879]
MRKSKSHLPKKRVMKAFSNAIKALNTESSSSENRLGGSISSHHKNKQGDTSLSHYTIKDSNMQTRTIDNNEIYFEIIGFEQSSAMQIISHYAMDCSVSLRLADSVPLHSSLMSENCDKLANKENLAKNSNNALPAILSQEYGIIAQGSTQNLDAFFKILDSLFAERLVKGDIATFVVKKLQQHNYKLCVAESCTGGVLSAMITAINGASSVFKGGITTYSIESKQQILGIKDSVFREHSVYSQACVNAMARGAIDLFQADIAIATSGLATYDDSPNNFLHLPAGMVFTCILIRDRLPINIAYNYLLDTNIEGKDSKNPTLYTPHTHIDSRILSKWAGAGCKGANFIESRIFVQKMASLQALRLLLSAIAS